MCSSSLLVQGNITLGLFGEIAPRTVENLVGLMQGNIEDQTGYAGAIFHRIIYNFMMQVCVHEMCQKQSRGNNH